MHNTNIPCGCLIEGDHQDYRIDWCPLHAGAPELLAVARACLGYFEYMAAQGSDFTPDSKWLEALTAVISRAT